MVDVHPCFLFLQLSVGSSDLASQLHLLESIDASGENTNLGSGLLCFLFLILVLNSSLPSESSAVSNIHVFSLHFVQVFFQLFSDNGRKLICITVPLPEMEESEAHGCKRLGSNKMSQGRESDKQCVKNRSFWNFVMQICLKIRIVLAK